MRDLLYAAFTIGFFALMLAYVRGCARLGRSGGEHDAADAERTRQARRNT